MSAKIRCAVYTRKSTDDGLEQEFNSLDAQREACEAFIKSQRGLGWVALATRYDDGGLSGGTIDRPALQALLADIEMGKVDTVVVYKVDRLTRSLADFAKIVDVLDARSARSRASASATRSRPPRRKACGWAGGRRSATTSRTRSSW